MNQTHAMHPFEDAKYRISVSSKKLYQYLIWATVLGLILFVGLIVTLLVILIPLGFSFEDFDLNDPYTSGQALLDSDFFSVAIAAAILLIIALVALLIIMIMSYVQYYRLGSGFNKLHLSDPRKETTRYISYGIYGYVIAIIAGIFIPDIGGVIVSILGNVSLAIGVFLIYQLFVDYKNEGRFTGKPSILLFIGIAMNVVSSISSLFSTYGTAVNLIGFILMLIGFNQLSKDILLVAPPGAQTAPAPTTQPDQPVQAVPPATETQPEPANERFCSKCGAKTTTDVKFCQNCGAQL